jgi:hypothetical protein
VLRSTIISNKARRTSCLHRNKFSKDEKFAAVLLTPRREYNVHFRMSHRSRGRILCRVRVHIRSQKVLSYARDGLDFEINRVF